MKIAVLADIHANYPSITEVSQHIDNWKPDLVIMAGDLVNRGPRPAECLAFALEKQASDGWRFIRGNHEDYVIKQSKSDAPRTGPKADVHRASMWTYKKLNCDVTFLESMPFKQDVVDPHGNLIRFVHASLLGNRDGIYPETTDTDLEPKIGYSRNIIKQTPVVFCAGHTHRPLIRMLNGVLVVNAGSAGLPFDGDKRPCYIQLTFVRETWRAEIIRLDYDINQAEEDFFETGYLEDGGPLVELVLIELRTATSQLYNWSANYQEDALLGKISMRQSVDGHISRWELS
jgi:predicted phosphodiesterase